MPKIKTSKEEVLQKVIPVLRIRGVSQSSMSQLAKACGIQKSHFYYYFKSKEELIKEVLSVVYSYFNYNFFKIIKNDTLSIEDKITLMKQLMSKIFTVSDGGCIMANTALETIHLNPIYKKEIKSFFQDFIDGLQLLLHKKYSPKESLLLAEQMVQDIEGGILLMRVYNDQRFLNNAISRMEKIILK
ncbi:TetR/AcrR family transcriptional regulator [Aquimarina sp. 2201CG5-10]|uniref:TetR/AcrR family transcriptional regulator n=1 Tax=Aquimarina callyspongiae TaxID=3098150 RepID=UPI002AB5AF90|nr:TetR/AcrR family transcriptional regulator [Aquimarina sp. 2201CG5-10]MDY8135666.1 TetR/AcrR family transcriptional regulator [Aquimarina sp. 2201CG5-10]